MVTLYYNIIVNNNNTNNYPVLEADTWTCVPGYTGKIPTAQDHLHTYSEIRLQH